MLLLLPLQLPGLQGVQQQAVELWSRSWGCKKRLGPQQAMAAQQEQQRQQLPQEADVLHREERGPHQPRQEHQEKLAESGVLVAGEGFPVRRLLRSQITI